LAVRDFGPFFGFVRGCPAASTLIVRALIAILSNGGDGTSSVTAVSHGL
jgi:hypothetical protein